MPDNQSRVVTLEELKLWFGAGVRPGSGLC